MRYLTTKKTSREPNAKRWVHLALFNPPASSFPASPFSWTDVSRLCRRICVLREQGQETEADRVQSGLLAESLATLRTPDDSAAAFDQRVEGIFAVERDRVANAAVLAELLAPLLAERLPLAEQPAAPATPAGHPVARVTRPLPLAPAGIADFIDEMIAQENAEGDGPGARRRAS